MNSNLNFKSSERLYVVIHKYKMIYIIIYVLYA